MTSQESFFFMLMVFVAIVLLSVAMIVPTVSSSAQAGRRMRRRIKDHLDLSDPGSSSLVREHYLKDLSPFGRKVESLPVLSRLSEAVEQSGVDTTAYKIVLTGLVAALIAIIGVMVIWQNPLIAVLLAIAVFFIPIISIYIKRKKRLDRFEEQLPEALDIMSRALKAGHPFNETLNFVGEEMDDPIAAEFSRIFSDLSFGLPLPTAFRSAMARIPSLSLHTTVTAVLIQHESGGRLAEILEKVAGVIRSRFKLQRKLKTLSAEGRMSAWVLGLVPFVLAGMMMVIAPNYLPVLLKNPTGLKIIGASFFMMCVGIFWIRKVIRIEV